MADNDTQKPNAPHHPTGDPELDARLDETRTPEEKQWWRNFIGAKSTGFTFSAEDYLRRSTQEE